MPGVTKPAGATRWKGEGTIWVILVQGAEKGRDRRIVCEMLIQKPRDPTAVEKNCAGMARLLFMRDNLSSLPPHVRDSTYIQLSAWAAGLDDRAWYEEQAKMLIEQRNENGPVPTAIDSTGPAAAPMATATATLTTTATPITTATTTATATATATADAPRFGVPQEDDGGQPNDHAQAENADGHEDPNRSIMVSMIKRSFAADYSILEMLLIHAIPGLTLVWAIY
jgi:hypothetical protein